MRREQYSNKVEDNALIRQLYKNVQIKIKNTTQDDVPCATTCGPMPFFKSPLYVLYFHKGETLKFWVCTFNFNLII